MKTWWRALNNRNDPCHGLAVLLWIYFVPLGILCFILSMRRIFA